jgi:alpha-soluble NSF attachment protein
MPSRGDELLAKAEKKGSSSVGWFGSSSTKWEEAGDLFQQASLFMECQEKS